MLAFSTLDMDRESLKQLMSIGDLVHCEILPPSARQHGWVVQVQHKNGSTLTLQGSRGSDKWFGKLQTAAEHARGLGFQRFGVFMPQDPRAQRIPPANDFD